MPTLPRRATSWPIRALTALLGLAALASFAALRPTPALAHGDIQIGGTAQVAFGTSEASLRAEPSWDAGVVALISGGTTVDILDGPVWSTDGAEWFNVAVWDQTGYMAADVLFGAGATPSEPAHQMDDGAAVPVDASIPAVAAADTATAAVYTATTTTALNHRTGPGTNNAVILVMPAGAALTVTGDGANGFLPVTYNGSSGWASAQYLSAAGTPPTPSPQPTPTADAAIVTSDLNLRSGPSTADAVILVMPAGSTVALTGQSSNGFSGVVYNGTTGWAFAQYLTSGGTPAPTPSPSPSPAPGPVTGTAVVTTALNLRAGPSTGDAVLAVMPAGVSVGITGGAQNGFYPVSYNGTAGWAFGTYLALGGAPAPSPTPSTPPTAGGSGITWPFGSGPWYISQGYNGSSHYNSGSSYQYYYSFDLARDDGATAGQAVLSPVSGTVRWTEYGSGGISIDLGNGYAVAFFHVTMDPSIVAGARVSQGQYMGFVSGPGGPGYVGFAHIHLTVWQTSDGGNWSRIAVPFTGANAIAGQSFPDTSGFNQHRGFRISR